MGHLVLPTSNNYYYQKRKKTIVVFPNQLRGLQTESIRALNRDIAQQNTTYNNLLLFLLSISLLGFQKEVIRFCGKY